MIINILFFLCLFLSISFAQGNLNTELIGKLNPQPQAGYNDIWGYVDSSGIEYALLGARNGFSVISLADPQNPVEVAFFPGQNTAWRDVKVHNSYAYVVADAASDGLWIIDLSQLPDTATLAAVNIDYFTRAHNIFIDNGYAYVIGTENGGGMHILDLSNPTNPERKSYYTGSGYIHDVYVWNDTVVACAGSSQSYHLIDVTDKNNPVKISESAAIPGIYAHSGWMTEDKRYFYATEEANNRDIIIWDLQDKTSWDFLGEFEKPSGSIVHNLFIKEDYAHISYYSEGYVVLYIADPASPVLVGQYDTYSGSNGGFAGAWGCYPYLPSGRILISDIQTGLYVLEFTHNDVPPFINHNALNEIYNTNPVSISAEINDDNVVTAAALYYRTIINGSTGNWNMVTNNDGSSGNEYQFIIPGFDHLTEIEYYFAAIDDNNNVATLPKGGSGINPPGNIPPAELLSYRIVIAGIPVINSFSPLADTTIPKNGKINFSIDAADTSMLELSYSWRRNSQVLSISVSSYNYVSFTPFPAPRTDTIKVEISNGHNSITKIWLVYVENITDINDDNLKLSYLLYQNYPNPFNPSTVIKFRIADFGFVNLKIYDILGNEIATLVNEEKPPGEYWINFIAENLPSGIYIAKIKAGNYSSFIKMTFLK